jgi:hypothetical protein
MTEICEVHNCYALYELNEDGSSAEKPLLCFNRPQDWGDPSRWHYHYVRIELEDRGQKYINHCHLWQGVQRQITQACQVIASSLFMVMVPGVPRELCDRSHLEGDDFWCSEWGERPPYYSLEEEDCEGIAKVPSGGRLYCWRVFHPDQERAVQETQETPLAEPPFPTATYLYTLTADGQDSYSMRSQEDQTVNGFLFGTESPEDQQLPPSWTERGWLIERQPSMERIG